MTSTPTSCWESKVLVLALNIIILNVIMLNVTMLSKYIYFRKDIYFLPLF